MKDLTKSTKFTHHPVKVIKELFMNDAEDAILTGNYMQMEREAGSANNARLRFDINGNLIIQPISSAGVVGTGILINIITRAISHISGDGNNLSCNVVIQ